MPKKPAPNMVDFGHFRISEKTLHVVDLLVARGYWGGTRSEVCRSALYHLLDHALEKGILTPQDYPGHREYVSPGLGTFTKEL